MHTIDEATVSTSQSITVFSDMTSFLSMDINQSPASKMNSRVGALHNYHIQGFEHVNGRFFTLSHGTAITTMGEV